MNINLRDMRQHTLVSLYGEKSEAFREYITGIFSLINECLGAHRIRYYDMEQMHGTIIGLETVELQGDFFNRNIWEKDKRKAKTDLSRIDELLDACFPIKIRFGGFGRSEEPFYSRGEIPWKRSFFIDRNNHRIVLMGWPHRGNDYSGKPLMHFREEMGRICSAGHKYSDDNDFYIVLGEWLRSDLSHSYEISAEMEKKVRDYLSENILDLDIQDIFIAQYTDPRLTTSSTRVRKIWKAP